MTDYKDARSLGVLGCQMMDLDDRQKAALASFLVDRGLMFPADWTSKLIWYTVRVIAKVRGEDRRMLYQAFLSHEDVIFYARDIVYQAIIHMISGRESSDPAAAGGFNQEEIIQIQWAVDQVKKFL